MMRRNQRLVASFTAMFVMAAVVFCACGTAAAPRRDLTASSAKHACCAPAHEQPSAPIVHHDDCAHCGSLTVAPAHASDSVSDLALAIFATPYDGGVLFPSLASIELQTAASHSASPPNLLSLFCALRL